MQRWKRGWATILGHGGGRRGKRNIDYEKDLGLQNDISHLLRLCIFNSQSLPSLFHGIHMHMCRHDHFDLPLIRSFYSASSPVRSLLCMLSLKVYIFNHITPHLKSLNSLLKITQRIYTKQNSSTNLNIKSHFDRCNTPSFNSSDPLAARLHAI